jgi:hypothetical protein
MVFTILLTLFCAIGKFSFYFHNKTPSKQLICKLCKPISDYIVRGRGIQVNKIAGVIWHRKDEVIHLAKKASRNKKRISPWPMARGERQNFVIYGNSLVEWVMNIYQRCEYNNNFVTFAFSMLIWNFCVYLCYLHVLLFLLSFSCVCFKMWSAFYLSSRHFQFNFHWIVANCKAEWEWRQRILCQG